MNSNPFRFTTVVDWIELEVRTISPHPAWRVWAAGAGAFSYVTGLDLITGEGIKHIGAQGKNTPTTRFAIRIQNPERFAMISAALDSIKDRGPLALVSVRSIEVAFDARNQSGTSSNELAEIAAAMLHQVNRPADTNSAPRLYKWQGTPEHRHGRKSLMAAILDGSTGMYGNSDDDYIVRGYLKNYDTLADSNGKPHRIALDNPLDHRARIEIRLQGEACPVRTLDELKSFKFECLASFFKFHQPGDSLTELAALTADRSATLGSVIDATGRATEAHRRRGRPRKTKAGSQASSLNEEARDQLRKLTRRWSREAGRSRHRDYENSGVKAVSEACISAPENSIMK